MRTAITVLALLIVLVTGSLWIADCYVVRAGLSKYGESWYAAKIQLTGIQMAMSDYLSDHAIYPTEEGLEWLLETPPVNRQGPRYWPDVYLRSEEQLVDPWGRRFKWDHSEDRCIVFTLGADGVFGGDGPNEDIPFECALPAT